MGTKKFRAIVVCTMLALGCVAWVVASGGTTEVRVYDAQGQLIQNGSMVVVNEAGDAVKTLARPDGVFEVNAVVGEKLEIFFGAETIGDIGAKFNQIVPASEEINLSVGVDAPANDLCSAATAVAIPSVTAGTTVGATLDTANAPTCVTTTTAPGVWYTVVGNGSTLRATTCPSLAAGASASYDTKISVYCKDCATPTCITGNDDVTCSVTFRSAVTWCSQAGATYNILVHGFSSATGTFNLAVNDIGPACTSTIQCLPTGACCSCLNPPFDCSVTDLNSCLALGGIPRGAGIGCFTLVGGPQSYVSNPSTFIPDNSTITGTITVPTSYTVGDVNVDLGITHTWIGDLDIRVKHSGKTQTIWDNRCSSSDNINATADDEGTVSLCAAINAGPINSTFYSPVVAGLGPLSIFDGQDAAGTWTIEVQDQATGDTGVLNQWSLHITEGNPTCELNVAVCHYPDTGPPPHTLVVGQSSVTHHLDHGDTIGPCAGDGGGTDGSFGRH